MEVQAPLAHLLLLQPLQALGHCFFVVAEAPTFASSGFYTSGFGEAANGEAQAFLLFPT